MIIFLTDHLKEVVGFFLNFCILAQRSPCSFWVSVFNFLVLPAVLLVKAVRVISYFFSHCFCWQLHFQYLCGLNIPDNFLRKDWK